MQHRSRERPPAPNRTDGSVHEKRHEPRTQSNGTVEILVDEPHSRLEFAGQLVDTSASGFRASHRHGALMNGLLVHFRHDHASGVARVIWNRIAGDIIETGFLIVSNGALKTVRTTQ